MTKPKPKRKGIVVTVCDGWTNFYGQRMYYVIPSRTESISACKKWLVRAGMKPLKPGESRKVRVTVEET